MTDERFRLFTYIMIIERKLHTLKRCMNAISLPIILSALEFLFSRRHADRMLGHSGSVSLSDYRAGSDVDRQMPLPSDYLSAIFYALDRHCRDISYMLVRLRWLRRHSIYR